jgi:hypothetical protein
MLMLAAPPPTTAALEREISPRPKNACSRSKRSSRACDEMVPSVEFERHITTPPEQP